MASAGNLTITPLPQALGATVTGLDLAHGLQTETILQLRAAWLDHLVLFFPKLMLTEEQQISLGRAFGDITAVSPTADDQRNLNRSGPNGEILVLNRTEDRKIRHVRYGDWHSDVSFTKTPPIGSLLAMKICAKKGGDTMWSNQYAAYEALSPEIKTLIENLQAEYGGPKTGSAIHPVVLRHPETGRKALFPSRLWTTRIVDLQPIESQCILEMLLRHCEQPEFQIRWQWHEGDAVLWDNRCTQHYAVEDSGDNPRLVHRVTIYSPGVIAAERKTHPATAAAMQ